MLTFSLALLLSHSREMSEVYMFSNSAYHDTSDFFKAHFGTTGRMIAILFDWMYDVCKVKTSGLDVYYRSLAVFMRFFKLSKIAIARKNLQGYGMLCIQMAQQYMEKYHMCDEDIVKICDNAYPIDQIKLMARIFRMTLKLDGSVPSWLELIQARHPSEETMKMVHILLLYTTQDYDLIGMYPIHRVAMAVLELAETKDGKDLKDPMCVSAVHKAFQNMYSQRQEGVKIGKVTQRKYPIVNHVFPSEYTGGVYIEMQLPVVDKPLFTKTNYSLGKQIGQGTYGCVYILKDSEGKDTECVVKRLETDSMSEGLRELEVLLNTCHPNVVSMTEYSYSMDGNYIYIVMPKANGTLGDLINQKGSLKHDQIVSFTEQICKGLWYLHDMGYLHRDIKPDNILVYPNDHIQICDFSIGRASGNSVHMTTEVGTLWYRPIDILLGNTNYSTSIDMWSVGCMMYCMATGEHMFKGDSEIDQLFRIFRLLGTPVDGFLATLPEFKSTFPKWNAVDLKTKGVGSLTSDGLDLMMKMLAYDPKDRISAKDALRHDYFKIDKQALKESLCCGC